MKHQLETDLFKKTSLDAGGKPKDPGKPTEASLDWKPNAHKSGDRELNPGVCRTRVDTLR